MKWTLNDAKFGDIIRVKIGQFYHYGIYVTDDEIIQFGLPFTDIRRDSKTVEVLSSDIDAFLCGSFLEVGEPERKDGKRKKPKDVVARARERLGEKGYHILYNNCEHFAFECMFGEKYCSQVEKVRNMWKSFPFVNVYVKSFPFEVKDKNIFSSERQKEIDACGSEKVREEKYYSWKLLEHGLNHSLGLDIKKIKFKKEGTKWTCPDCQFSISHCDNIVAVVVARNNVGIDIEKIDTERFAQLPKEKILTEEELNIASLNLNEVWTVKEAIFKSGQEKTFIPSKININSFPFITKKLQLKNSEYYLTIATKDLSVIKYFIDEEIKQ